MGQVTGSQQAWRGSLALEACDSKVKDRPQGLQWFKVPWAAGNRSGLEGGETWEGLALTGQMGTCEEGK